MSDPILASNPLDKYVPDYQALVVMYGELWRKAAALQAALDSSRQEANRYRVAAGNEAQTRAALETTIVTLRESAAFDAEMRRSLTASVEEMREETARLENRIRELAEVKLERFEATPGHADLTLKTNPVILEEMAEMMIGLLKSHGAPNYVSFAVNHPTGQYEMNVQRLAGVRPSEMATQQRERADKAEAALAAAVLREREEIGRTVTLIQGEPRPMSDVAKAGFALACNAIYDAIRARSK